MTKYSQGEYTPLNPSKYIGKMPCQICASPFNNLRGLSAHFRQKHSLEPKEYYDRFIKLPTDGVCAICAKPTEFKGIGTGYLRTCGHKCGGKLFRSELKNDQSRFEIFKDTVSANQIKIWAQREKDGTKQDIIDSAVLTAKTNNAKLTVEERKEKFGWLNGLTGVDREQAIDKNMAGLRDWWNNATLDEKKHVYVRRLTTRIKLGLCNPREYKNEYEEYSSRVRQLTETNYRKHKSTINPDNLPRGRGNDFYHIDHIVSIWDCFNGGVPAEMAAAPSNLQMLIGLENNRKWKTSQKTIDQLLKEIYDDEV